MIAVEYIHPLYQERQQFPSIISQPIKEGDFVRSRSGADFLVKAVGHSSRMQQVPDSDSWKEVPVVIVELMEK
jgi:hypothetical protein